MSPKPLSGAAKILSPRTTEVPWPIRPSGLGSAFPLSSHVPASCVDGTTLKNPWVHEHDIGNPPCLIGNTSTHSWWIFQPVILVFVGGKKLEYHDGFRIMNSTFSFESWEKSGSFTHPQPTKNCWWNFCWWQIPMQKRTPQFGVLKMQWKSMNLQNHTMRFPCERFFSKKYFTIFFSGILPDIFWHLVWHFVWHQYFDLSSCSHLNPSTVWHFIWHFGRHKLWHLI